MREAAKRRGWLSRGLLTLAALWALAGASLEVYGLAWGSGRWIGRISPKWALTLAAFELLFLLALGLAVAALWFPGRAAPLKRAALALRERMGRWRWLPAALAALFPAWFFLYSPWADLFTGDYLRFFGFVSSVSLTAVLAGKGEEKLASWASLLASGVAVGSVFAVAAALTSVTDYPFSLYWSEGNRIWDYSVMYGRRLYDYPLEARIRVYTDRGRQSLWGLPFLLPGVSIWGVRLWSAVLFTVPYALLGWVVIRSRRGALAQWFFFGLWVMIFLNQGPIYTPLVLAAILVAGVRRAPLWLALPVVALAAYYARFSRVTWMFAPALWGGMLALAQVSAEERALQARDWLRAALFGLAGLLGGFVIPDVWRRLQQLSGPQAQASLGEQLGSTTQDVLETGENLVTRQPLLWSRLWPNATFDTGIVLGLLLASLPLVLLLVYLARTRRWPLDRWQALALAAPLLAFLAVGLVASVKIGGGTNLHNLDMFLIGVVFAAALAWEAGLSRQVGQLLGNSVPNPAGPNSPWARLLLILAVAVPAFAPFTEGRALRLPPPEKTQTALDTVRGYAACAKQHGQVLFLDQRQLLTFGFVQDVPLVPEYEKKHVMDEALSGNAAYFERFYADLEAGRFSLIVADRQNIRFKESGEGLAEENNAWVKWVTIPLLRHYESVQEYKPVGVELFMPRGRSYECP